VQRRRLPFFPLHPVISQVHDYPTGAPSCDARIAALLESVPPRPFLSHSITDSNRAMMRSLPTITPDEPKDRLTGMGACWLSSQWISSRNAKRNCCQPDPWAQWIQVQCRSNLSAADLDASRQLPVHSIYFWRRTLASDSKPKKMKNFVDARLAERKGHQKRRVLRQKHSVSLLEELPISVDDQQFLPKSPTGEAARYNRNQWAALNR
jgi:hypothetical protein